MTLVLIGLGADLGDPPAMFRRAQSELAQAGLLQPRLSSLYESVGIDAPGTFINAALLGDWPDEPRPLLDLCLAIERRAGRRRSVRNAPRVLDLDLLLFADHILHEPGLDLPHPRLAQRRFALEPCCELQPDALHPVLGRPLRDLLAEPAIQAQSVKCLAPA